MTKVCTRCSTEKPQEEFYKQVGGKLGKSSHCKPCRKNTTRLWNTKNKASLDEKRRAWHVNNRERSRKQSRDWAKKNTRKMVYRSITHRDRKRGFSSFTYEEYIAFQGEPCHYCGFLSTGWDRIDNSIGHVVSNVVPACVLCNLTRGDRWTFAEMETYIGPAIRMARGNRT